MLRALVTGIMVLHIRTGLRLEDRLKTAVFHSFYMMKKPKHIMLKDLMNFAHFENEDELLRKLVLKWIFKKKNLTKWNLA